MSRTRRLREGPIGLRACALGDGAPPRVGYAIGRAAGSAPARNRLRRRLRATVRANSTTLRDGNAYLFYASRAASGLAPGELDGCVRRLLARAGSIR